jgi:hypothetical protein
MSKFSVTCLNWRRASEGFGIATIRFDALGLVISDVAVCRLGPLTWVESPLAPATNDGELIRDAKGEIQWTPAVAFEPEAAEPIIAAVKAYDADPWGPA